METFVNPVETHVYNESAIPPILPPPACRMPGSSIALRDGVSPPRNSLEV